MAPPARQVSATLTKRVPTDNEVAMSLTVEDRLEIHEVIALHGHLCDAGAYARFGEVFTSDLEVDASDLGLAPLPTDPSRPRLDTYIAAAHRRGPAARLPSTSPTSSSARKATAPGHGPRAFHLRGSARANESGLAHQASKSFSSS
jgi:hypothetical protein